MHLDRAVVPRCAAGGDVALPAALARTRGREGSARPRAARARPALRRRGAAPDAARAGAPPGPRGGLRREDLRRRQHVPGPARRGRAGGTPQRRSRAQAAEGARHRGHLGKPVRRWSSPDRVRHRLRRRLGAPAAAHRRDHGADAVSAIKVMVVDDSAVVRQVVAGLLGAAPGIQVLAAVADPLLAIERLRQAWPDVIVLDVEMPRMDGITFLRKIMAERPTPVGICSTLTEKGAKTTLEALAAGAVAIVTKPRLGLKQFLAEAGDELVATVRAAARANVRRLLPRADAAPLPVAPKNTADVILAPGGPR